MKNLIIIAALTFASFKMNAQDVIKMKNGIEMKGVVTEVTTDQVKFKKTPDGPIYSIAKSDVQVVTYENGTQENFTTENAPAKKTETTKTTSDEEDVLDVAKHYGGPRVGFTVLGDGTSNDKLANAYNRKVNPVISQFGWQFETRIFTLKDGSTGLVEFVPMIGGLEQGLFLPSATAVIGFRAHSGFELGVGPTVSLGGAGIVFAAGASYHVGKVTFPVNLVFSPSITKTTLPSSYQTYDQVSGGYVNHDVPSVTTRSGFRVSLVIGFNSRKN